MDTFLSIEQYPQDKIFEKMNLKKLKIFFFGTSFFAKEILRLLLENGINISCVVTRSDKPGGRERKFLLPDVKIFSLEKKISLRQFEKIDDKAFLFFQKENPDLIIVAAYGTVLPKKLISLPKFKCINFHASLLPDLRGPSPIQTALLKNKKFSGITLMEMDNLIDHGKIIAKRKVLISPSDDYFSLEKKLLTASNEMIPGILERHIKREIKPIEQNHKKATFTKRIRKNDGKIDWNLPAQEIYNKYRAFKKWPKIFSFWKNKKIILEKIRLLEKNSNKMPGDILKRESIVAVQTKEGLISIEEIQLEGKRVVNIKSFINGYPTFIESKLE